MSGDRMKKQNDYAVAPEARSAEARGGERTLASTRGGTHRRAPHFGGNGSSFVSRRRAPSDWQRAMGVLSKQWRSSALFALIVFAAVTAVTFAMRPVYEPEGRLQIDPPGSEVFSLDAAGAGL